MEERRTLDFKDPEHQMLLQHLMINSDDCKTQEKARKQRAVVA